MNVEPSYQQNSTNPLSFLKVTRSLLCHSSGDEALELQRGTTTVSPIAVATTTLATTRPTDLTSPISRNAPPESAGGASLHQHCSEFLLRGCSKRLTWTLACGSLQQPTSSIWAQTTVRNTSGATSSEADTIPDAPSPRFGHTAVVYDDKAVVIFGGKSSERYFNDVYAYNVTEQTWQCLHSGTDVSNSDERTWRDPSIPPGRVGHAAAMYHDVLYVVSGENQGHFFTDLHAFHVATRTWELAGRLPFSPRKGHTMHLLQAEHTATRATKDMFVIFGGLVKVSRSRERAADPPVPHRHPGEPDHVCAATNAVLLYYPTQQRWCQLRACGEIPAPRFYHVSQMVTGTAILIVFGGRTTDTADGEGGRVAEGSFLNDLYLLDVSTGFWRAVRDATGEVPSPRMCAASVFVNGVFAVFAGGSNNYSEDAYEFYIQRQLWRRIRPGNQPACSRPTVSYARNRLIFFGGFAPQVGVMNCTMEMQLPLMSLKCACLMWWTRGLFEKELRISTQKKYAWMEERCLRGCPHGCGGQITLRPSPSATPTTITTASSVPYRMARRPDPIRVPSISVGTPQFSDGGMMSPAPSRQPSSPQPHSPIPISPQSGVSQDFSHPSSPQGYGAATRSGFPSFPASARAVYPRPRGLAAAAPAYQANGGLGNGDRDYQVAAAQSPTSNITSRTTSFFSSPAPPSFPVATLQNPLQPSQSPRGYAGGMSSSTTTPRSMGHYGIPGSYNTVICRRQSFCGGAQMEGCQAAGFPSEPVSAGSSSSSSQLSIRHSSVNSFATETMTARRLRLLEDSNGPFLLRILTARPIFGDDA